MRGTYILVLSLVLTLALAPAQEACDETAAAHITVDQGHPWRPPFGLDRVGSPPVARVKLVTEQTPRREYHLTAYHDGREVEKHKLDFAPNPSLYNPSGFGATEKTPSFFAHVPLTAIPSEVALLAQCGGPFCEVELP